MEPVSTAIMTALAAGALDGVKNAAGKAVAESYAGLRALVVRKFGNNTTVVSALDKYEDTPDSERRKKDLIAAFAEHHVDGDAEIVEAAGKVHQALTLVHMPVQINVDGDGNAIGNNGATVTVTNTFNKK